MQRRIQRIIGSPIPRAGGRLGRLLSIGLTVGMAASCVGCGGSDPQSPEPSLAEAIQYTLNQWRELTVFTSDQAVPIHNNLAEQQMKRIALLRKNALFAGSPRGGETAAILSTLTSTCRRHEIDPQAYLTELLANLPDTPVSRVDEWLPDTWKRRREPQPLEPSPLQA